MKRSITWEKWIDVIPEEVGEAIPEANYDDDDEFIESNFENFIEFAQQPLKIRTPIGTYEHNEPLSPSNMYDCWIGHTNFRIMDADAYILENSIDGIEQIKVMSKYRFFIGVAKMFEFKKVRIEVDKKICKNPEHLNYKTNSWAMFLGNDGSQEKIIQTKNMSEEEFEEKIKELKKMSNGSFIRSEST
jgi:hypothetical protein